MEITPLEGTLTQVSLTRRTDVEVTQYQGVPGETQAQADAKTSTRTAVPVDSKS